MKIATRALAACTLLGCQGSELERPPLVSDQSNAEPATSILSDFYAMKPQEEAKFSEQAEKRFAEVQKAIEREAAALGPDHWAGTYYYRDGLGVNVHVSIAPEAGFAFEWHGCLGLYDRNYGAVKAHGHELRPQFEFPNSREGFQGLHDSFVPVRWGDRQYLVAVKEMAELCNAANQGNTEPYLLLKEVTEDAKVFGKPEVPEEYSGYLVDPPIQANVTLVGEPERVHMYEDRYTVDTPLTLDVGEKDGVLVDMEFTLVNSGVAIHATVTAVQHDSCEAVVRQDTDDKAPTADWKMWTGAPYCWDDEWVARNPGLSPMTSSE